MKTILLDLDNTLFETLRGSMTPESKVFWNGLDELRRNSDGEIELVGFTSRPWPLRPITLITLWRIGIKLDRLLMGKPRGNVYVGNRAVNFDCRYSSADHALQEVNLILNK